MRKKVNLETDPRVLQICHSGGSVKLDGVESREEILALDGVLEVKLLYLTDDDARPVQAVTRLVPFHYEAEVPGIREDSSWYLEPGLEQLTAVMAGGGQAELRGVIAFDLLVLQPEPGQVIRQVQVLPADTEKMKAMPGIVGYFVQPQDSLWDVAKHFHTTGGLHSGLQRAARRRNQSRRLPDPGKGNWMSFRKNKKTDRHKRKQTGVGYTMKHS